jgi:hypothetical protein
MIDESLRADGRAGARLTLCSTLVAATLGLAAAAMAQQSAEARQKAQLEQYEQLLRTTVGAAETACLSNTSTQEGTSLRLKWHAIVGQIASAAGVEKKTEVIRGAARDLPASAQLIENDKIRNCINEKIQPVLAMVVQTYQHAAPNAAWPDPIDFRFNFIRGPSRDPQMYTEYLRVNLQTRRRPLSRRLVIQDPQGAAYFQQDVGYPQLGETVSGTIVAERIPDARLTSTPPVITDVCFQRPPNPPSAGSTDYDLFDCPEGKVCRPSARATGWLQICPAQPGARPAAILPSFVRAAYAAGAEQPSAPAAAAPYWSVPSLEALAQRNVEGVGYTVFTVETDAFRRPDITGVAVDVRVNGVPVREDGLLPELRPVANEPQSRFTHRFALQTLDFEGAQGGCDRIDIGLRPLLADGRKGDALTSTLTYVALRDVAPRAQRLGDAELKWSAAYITPQREWRHIAEVHSYIYSTRDAATQERAVEQAQADKRWLDGQALTYNGQKLVGVIRPPRTVKPDGTAAYGLGAGLIQENGQVRFTFSEGDARKLAAFMIAQRNRGADAARIIHREPYIFQAVGGSYTAGGVCEEPVRNAPSPHTGARPNA